MKKIAVSVLVLLAMLLVSCADSMDTSDVLAARAAGDIKWSDEYKASATTMTPYMSERNNASGKGVTKITSNAHSADCPDVYFRWDSKQKDDCYLLVKESFFEEYEGFLLTVKVSSTYWDYPINLEVPNLKAPVGGLYVFAVPKGKAYNYFDNNGEKQTIDSNKGCGKNINMVFISNKKLINKGISEIFGETDVKDSYTISFKKVVADSNFAKGEFPVELWKNDAKDFVFDIYYGKELVRPGVTLNDDMTATVTGLPYAGTYTIVERIEDAAVGAKYTGSTQTANPINATKTITIKSDGTAVGAEEVENAVLPGLGGDGILKVWKDKLPGFDAAFKDAKFIWDRHDSWQYGLSGSEIIYYTTEFKLDTEITKFDVSFACDNAAVMFVNGKLAGYTEDAFEEGREIPTYEGGFSGLNLAAFDGGKWQRIYTVNIAKYLEVGEMNKVVFYAANSAYDPDCSVNSTYDINNNPAGIIFYGQAVIDLETTGGSVATYTNSRNKGISGNGTAGLGIFSDGDSSEFTYADLTGLQLNGEWQAFPVVFHKKMNQVGQVFVRKYDENGKTLVDVVIDGTSTSGSNKFLLTNKAPQSSNGNSIGDNVKGLVLTGKVYEDFMYYSIHADFNRF